MLWKGYGHNVDLLIISHYHQCGLCLYLTRRNGCRDKSIRIRHAYLTFGVSTSTTSVDLGRGSIRLIASGRTGRRPAFHWPTSPAGSLTSPPSVCAIRRPSEPTAGPRLIFPYGLHKTTPASRTCEPTLRTQRFFVSFASFGSKNSVERRNSSTRQQHVRSKWLALRLPAWALPPWHLRRCGRPSLSLARASLWLPLEPRRWSPTGAGSSWGTCLLMDSQYLLLILNSIRGARRFALFLFS